MHRWLAFVCLFTVYGCHGVLNETVLVDMCKCDVNIFSLPFHELLLYIYTECFALTTISADEKKVGICCTEAMLR